MSATKTIPPGYWEDAKGVLYPVSTVKAIDKERSKVVAEVCAEAKDMSSKLAAFKLTVRQHIDEFLNRSAAEYGAAPRGLKGKGNVTLTTFDGRYKVVRQVQDKVVFDERLQIAKQLIDECIHEWSKGSKAEIKAIVNHAFQVDKAGNISTGRVLGLRTIKSDDPKWAKAMQAINDSIQVAGSKAYDRFYERDEATGEYFAINLDVAAV